MFVDVIGAGLAGVESAHALANRGIRVRLHEMKPVKFSPAHSYPNFAELVCSNSLKSDLPTTAGGLLKAEMRALTRNTGGSIILETAELTRVPAGGALAVDREAFSDGITRRIRANPNIEVVEGEVTEFPERNAIIATGPLTSDTFALAVREHIGGDWLSFYDAAAPIVHADSIDMNKAFMAGRYDKGGADYINCVFDKTEYELFYNALINAEPAQLHDIDRVYEGCMPVEILAKRGIDSIRFGCMKPVGLTDPRTGKRPYAAVQLRKENTSGTMYNLVGFQTNLKFGEQKRVFSLIPGLENAEFVRYGVMHRNTFINSPRLLDSDFRLRGSDNVYFAGQITGVEGYMESAASGIIAGLAMAADIGRTVRTAPSNITMLGALTSYISSPNVNYQPMGANMGLLPPLGQSIKNKQERYAKLAERALQHYENSN
jgi:methylenetetrahydrofolate--tRNA-(uracil-5-)-methyltransferase